MYCGGGGVAVRLDFENSDVTVAIEPHQLSVIVIVASFTAAVRGVDGYNNRVCGREVVTPTPLPVRDIILIFRNPYSRVGIHIPLYDSCVWFLVDGEIRIE